MDAGALYSFKKVLTAKDALTPRAKPPRGFVRAELRPQARAAPMSANACSGDRGRYFRVRNDASENELSSLTHGRENNGMRPKRRSAASIVAPFTGEPLSECNTTSCGETAST